MRSARPQADGDEEEPSVATKRSKHTAGESSSEQAGSASARALGQGWHFLKAPTAKDVRGNRRCRKALDAPLRPFEYLVVRCMRWCEEDDVFRNRKKLHPLEIIEFPSVMLQMSVCRSLTVSAMTGLLQTSSQSQVDRFLQGADGDHAGKISLLGSRV
eukprot:755602-Hanusia_phi.AAC.1